MTILLTALALATAAPPAAQAAAAPAAHADHAKMKHGEGKECCCKDMGKAGNAATRPAPQSEHQH